MLDQRTLNRRSFMRRMLGAGVGLLSLEFIGGTLAFLWPAATDVIGVEHEVGTLQDVAALYPTWVTGTPAEFRPAAAFLVNVPAAKALALGEPISEPNPPANGILALWRRCPHLGCMIPAVCDTRHRFQCRCHQSTYTILGEKLQLGPAPRGMDRFPVRIDERGVLIVDTREVIAGPPPGQLTFRDPFPVDVGCA
jgi:cytochrome b6-f complex iron-sulfur subunit